MPYPVCLRGCRDNFCSWKYSRRKSFRGHQLQSRQYKQVLFASRDPLSLGLLLLQRGLTLQAQGVLPPHPPWGFCLFNYLAIDAQNQPRGCFLLLLPKNFGVICQAFLQLSLLFLPFLSGQFSLSPQPRLSFFDAGPISWRKRSSSCFFSSLMSAVWETRQAMMYIRLLAVTWYRGKSVRPRLAFRRKA